MASPDHKSILECSENAHTSSWKGKLIIQGCVLCDMTLWSTYDAVIPGQLPQELDFKYVMKVSSLKEKLPDAVFRKQIYLEQNVCCNGLCFSLYEVELSNKQEEKVDKLTEYIKNQQLAIIKHLEDRGFLILLTSSSLISEPDSEDEKVNLYGLHLFHSPQSKEVKDSKIEDDISLKVIPILPALNCALIKAKKLLPEEGIHLNTLVKRHLQKLYKKDGSLPLNSASQDEMKENTFLKKLARSFDFVSPPEKCPGAFLAQLKSYFSDPSDYAVEVSAALGSLAEHPPSPFVSDGVCDSRFSLVVTPDHEFLDIEAEVRKDQTKSSSEKMLKTQEAADPGSPAANLRVQPKRKASVVPMVQSKEVSPCHPPTRRKPGSSIESHSPATLKLVKGQFPQRRKRGAEVLTAQFVQKTRLNRKIREAPVSKDVPVVMSAKRTRSQETAPARTVERAKQPGKKSPPKKRVNIIRKQSSRIRKKPQTANEETALQLQTEILSNGQKDGRSVNTAQPEGATVAQKDLPEHSIINYDSQALNMLADLALSSVASSTPLCEPRTLPCSSESPQNDVLLAKESSSCGSSDHEYHRDLNSPNGVLLPKPSCDRKSNSGSLFTVSQEETLVPCSQMPSKVQSALREETLETSGASQNSFVAVEHSYALHHAEHSKKHLHQRGLPAPAFAKNGTKGPEAGTPVGKVMPFRHLQNTSPLQKLSEDSLIKRKSRFISSSLKNTFSSYIVLSCDGSLKVTFKCEAEYSFSLDSKYTKNPLEKTVLRALHGPWNNNLPDNTEEVKLLFHIWVALFYSNRNKIIRSSRKVVEHSNPAKYVSINSTLESFDLSDIEESSSIERCSVEPVLETNETSRTAAVEASIPGPNGLFPFIMSPPTRGLEFCVQNEQREVFARECHLDASERPNFIYSCNNEVIGGNAKQESSDKQETSNLVHSAIGSTRTNGPFTSGEARCFQSRDNKRQSSYDDTDTQATFTQTYDEASSQSEECQKSVHSLLESKDSFHAAVPRNTDTLQDLIQHSSSINSESQPSSERTDDNMGYAMTNLKAVTLAFEKDACVSVYTEVNRADKPVVCNSELISQVSPAASLRHPLCTLEEAQKQGLRDIPSLVVSGQKGTRCLSASSVKRKTFAEELCSLQKETPLPVSSPPSDKALIIEGLSLIKCSSHSLSSEEMKYSQKVCVQTHGLSSEDMIEPLQIDVVSPSSSAVLGEGQSRNSVPPKSDIPGGCLELGKADESSLSCKNKNLELFNSVFHKQIQLSMNREEVSLELLEENSDTELTLKMSPCMRPRAVSTSEIEQLQEDSRSSLKLQEIPEEIVKPKEVVLTEEREVNSANCMSAYSMVSKEPQENKRKGDSLQPVTLMLPKENCSLEMAEEIVTSEFPFGSLIEEVSPASSPNPPVPNEEKRPSLTVSSCSLKLPDTQHEKNKFSQIEPVDLTITENSLVGPAPPVGQENLTQVQEVQLPAEMSLMLNNCPGRKGTLIRSSKVMEEVVPTEHGEGLSSSEKMQCCNTDLNNSANYGSNFKPSLEKHVKSGNSLQKRLVDTLVSAPAVSRIVNLSLKEQASPESIKETVCDSDSKTDASSYTQVKSVGAASIDRADVTQANMHPEIPEFGSSPDNTTFTHGPGSERVEPGFQTPKIPVRLASLLKDGGIEAVVHEESTDLDDTDFHSDSTPTKDEHDTIHMLQDPLTYEIKGLSNGRACSYRNTIDTSENINKENSSLIPESFDTYVCGISKEHIYSKNTVEGSRTMLDSEALGRDVEMSLYSDMHNEPLSGDSDQDFLNDCRNPKLDMKNSCTLRSNRTSKKEDATKDDYDSFRSLNNSDNETWGYSNRVPELDMSVPSRHWATELRKEDRCIPCYVQIRDLHGIPRTYVNFTVTKEFCDTTTLHSLKRHPGFTTNSGLLGSWKSTWYMEDDLTQSTLDLEHLRFALKIKEILKKGGSQKSACCTNILPKESSPQISFGAFPLTKKSEASVLHPPSKSRSPILVTVVHSDAGRENLHRRNCTPSSLDSPSSSGKERCSHGTNLSNPLRNQSVTTHLNKLKYNSTLKESRNISLILSEYAQFSKVMMNSNKVVFQGKESNVTSQEGTCPEEYPSFQRESTSYEDMITDLCANLHIKLKSVLKEACKSPFFFYLVETEDRSFCLRAKSILRKQGHTEIEPQHFSQAFHGDNGTLIVIIRNEDISSHLHLIPSLLKLKQLPNVLFAGVDSPEDVLNDTYQELFRTGGFVVSDDKLLETITLAQLKEIVKTLEKLNGNGRWRWLLHYRENKRLKEDTRVDSVAHKKNLILKSCQRAHIIELLHYHQCDSHSQTKGETLKCLINLQIQHMDARFAIFLTEKPPVFSEIFENNGIFAIDVNNFIENIQKIAAPFKSNYW
ncbi:protein TASOR 2 [Ctenodactylus gundi]